MRKCFKHLNHHGLILILQKRVIAEPVVEENPAEEVAVTDAVPVEDDSKEAIVEAVLAEIIEVVAEEACRLPTEVVWDTDSDFEAVEG